MSTHCTSYYNFDATKNVLVKKFFFKFSELISLNLDFEAVISDNISYTSAS